MNLTGRLKRAALAFLGRDDVIGTMVRPSDVASGGRWIETPAKELVKRYSGWVKVCASRNASGIASTPLRVYSAKKRASRAWNTRPIGRHVARSVIGSTSHTTRKLMERVGDDLEEITDPLHPLVALLTKANQRDNGYDLIETMMLSLELTGNGYLIAVPGSNGWPVEVWPALSQYMRAVPDPVRFIGSYVFGTGEEVKQSFDPGQVVHIRYPNPMGDPYYGMGPLAACVVTADIETAAAQHQLQTIQNGATPGLVVSAPNATETQRKQIEASLNARTKGPQNAGRSLVLAGDKDVTVTQWSMTEKEVSYLASATNARDKIAAIFDIPTALISQENAALATAQAALSQWQVIGLRPRKQRIEDKLNEQLIPMFAALGDDTLCVAMDDPYTEDQSAAVSRNVTTAGFLRETLGQVQSGMLAPEAAKVVLSITMPGEAGKVEEAVEAAAAAMLPELELPAFELPRPTAQSPNAGAATPAAQATPATETPAATEPDDEEDDGEEPPPPPPPSDAARKACGCGACVSGTGKRAATGKVVRASDAIWGPEAATLRQQDDKLKNWPGDPADGQQIVLTEAQLERALRRWFRATRPAIESGINLENNAVNVDLAGNENVVEAFNLATQDKLERLYRLGYNRASADVAGKATIPEYDNIAGGVAEYIRGYSKKVVQSVSDTVSDRIKEAIAASAESGGGKPEAELAIQQILGPGSEVAAARIAQTESVRLYGAAREDGWVQSGVVSRKSWMLSGDPCQLCLAMSEKFASVPVGQPMMSKGSKIEYGDGQTYLNDYDTMNGPPGHPNCRCDIGAVFED